ncbi:MAG: hypothetical protein ACKO6K_01795, partial [Chitinophagaceae bacterium]
MTGMSFDYSIFGLYIMKPATLLFQGLFGFLFLVIGPAYSAFAQVPVPVTVEPPTDTIPAHTDSVLRIKNLNPYITLHVDSSLQYNLEINRDKSQYYFYLKNSPIGLKIDKDNGQLSFKAEKSFFLSGKLKYDYEYKVRLGVQNLNQPADRLDTTFSILF